ncbi:pentatricopeptide repeat-containing protein At5g66520-like [Macadamia integrifolia]|uniref:pentatricopeptide repeat-containing protein At5g66520-like n=1 Tax=Macadamia integrifolia TaxID=60698 RepID=UPI001C4E59C1|nr:pentatricopeptide repeat-containing protein At5g66520-like [Macadamia integrifolia]XP_042515496.1 pentatricopeptide repeat-containing protein At5g66520-like [Macadamia integrifolia]XP_042515497.1 pentatricopeptide repeat-containing protein At5g66520-like [Macadamia integrifolia]XP_042515498.1 pentatricopeptide repeat-containing protein At5g66520-like [Macadamia integrifolia]
MSGNGRKCLKLLEKCKNIKQLKQTHAQIITSGLGNDNFALSRILAFCSDPHRGSLSHAWQLFEQIEQPTMCICNTMIKAFLHNGDLIKTIEMYIKMLQNGLYPDNYTLPYVLKACANLQNSRLGEQIHGSSVKLGFLLDIFVGNTLILMYSNCGKVESARRIFDEMPWQDAVTWTVLISGYVKWGDVDTARLLFDEALIKDKGVWGSMISGYVQNNCFKEGLQMFRLMQSTDLEPDEAIFASVLCACAHLGALDIGIWIHRYVNLIGIPLGVRLNTVLIDMYARCGYLSLARKLFDGMQQKDVICWNVMISGLAMQGDGDSALKLFSEMERVGLRPDDITFLAVLTACSHSGMVFEGLQMFNSMSEVYGIEPKSEHLGCMVDFLGRAGLFKEAKEIVQKIPSTSNASEKAIAWRALLNACCHHRETQLAELAAEQLMRLERHSGAYVLLSNMYAASGKYEDAKRIRKKMYTKGVEKIPGCSSIEINGSVHEFIAGEKTHLRMGEIHELLEKMNKHLEG